VIVLRHRGHAGRDLPHAEKRRELERHELHRRELGRHLDELLLDELEARDGPPELLALLRVPERMLERTRRRARRLPSDAHAANGEYLADVVEGLRLGEAVFGWNVYVIQRDLGVEHRALAD